MAASRLDAIFAAHEIFAPSQIIPGMFASVLSIVALICEILPPTRYVIAAADAQDAETAPQNADSFPINSF